MALDTNFTIILPELFLLGMIVIILLADVFSQKKIKQFTYRLTQLALIGTFLLSLLVFNDNDGSFFYGMVTQDRLSSLLKLTIELMSMGVFLFSRDYLRAHRIPEGEFYVLGLFSILGMMVTVSAHHLLSLYLGLELMSLPIYAMVALQRDNPLSVEAAIKYFVLGVIASGILLFGFSLLYGVTHTLALNQIVEELNASFSQSISPVALLAMVFIVVGIAFKIGLVPFHMWIPDVYAGAPTATTLFITVAPKLAAFGLMSRLLIDALGPLTPQWQILLNVMAMLSIVLGNITAIAQTNIKRMLAYSTIAHAGYMLLGFVAASPEGYASAMFYALVYALMSLGAFGLLTLLSNQGIEVQQVDDLRGLNSRNPGLAFMALIVMFSMAGLPPTVGFFAKVGVIEALFSQHFIFLPIFTMIFAVMGSYYYLRIVKTIYFDEPLDRHLIYLAWDARLGISLVGIATLALGILPSPLISLCHIVWMG